MDGYEILTSLRAQMLELALLGRNAYGFALLEDEIWQVSKLFGTYDKLDLSCVGLFGLPILGTPKNTDATPLAIGQRGGWVGDTLHDTLRAHFQIFRKLPDRVYMHPDDIKAYGDNMCGPVVSLLPNKVVTPGMVVIG